MKDGKSAAKMMSDFVNAAATGDRKEFVEVMGKEHRTLQQNFTRLCVQWFKHLSDQERYDLRNEASVRLAKEIMQKCNTSLPYI